LKPLNSKYDVLHLTKDCKGLKAVEIYVEHFIDVPLFDEG